MGVSAGCELGHSFAAGLIVSSSLACGCQAPGGPALEITWSAKSRFRFRGHWAAMRA